MGLSVNTNNTALTAYRLVGTASKRLGSSVEKLSSGLRINHAQDDPAGLAIAEKIRTQVNGLNRASMNAQDGVSLLQTAEGALGEVQNILQRVRTLAVQAANGTLTASDRVEIQAEVDQLLNEVDRTSIATEFNTKKLLDGSLSALVSVDDSDLTPIITGEKVVEGNYRLEKQMTPGQGEVLKSDIFRVVKGEQYKFGTRGLASEDDITNTLFNAADRLDSSDFTMWQDMDYTLLHDDAVEFGSTNTNQDFRLDYNAAATGNVTELAVVDAKLGGVYTGFTLADAVNGNGTAITNASPYVSLEIVGVRGTDDASKLTVNGDAMVIDGTTFAANEQRIQVKITTYSRTGEVMNQATQEYSSVDFTAATDYLQEVDFAAGMADITFVTDGDVVTVGDKILLLVQDDTQFGGAGAIWASQDGSQVSDATTADNGTFTAQAAAGIDLGDGTVEVNRVGAAIATSSANASIDGVSASGLSIGWIDNDGRVHIGTGDFRFSDPGATVAANGDVQFNLFESTLAERVTELQNIDRFQVGGASLFEPYAQKLTIYSNAQQADIVLEAKDTLEGVATKLRMAIVSSVPTGGLGMGIDGDLTVTGVDHNSAVFVSEAQENTDEAVAGTVVLRSTVPGTDGRFFFAGDENLIKGFSWATVRDATLNSMKVDVYNAHSGDFVGSQTFNDGVMRSVIAGVDVAINQRTDVTVVFDTDTATAGVQGGYKYHFESGAGKAIENIHVVDNSLTLQIGANRGQTLDAIVGQVDRNSLELANLLVVDRDVAEEALVRVDTAINKVSHQRALMGAYINRLNSTMNINDITAENLTAAESRIRDLDMARQVIDFTRDQVLTQAATAMLAQANTLPQTVLTLLR